MEMRILCELSRWILEDPSLKPRWGLALWREAFEACGSHREWSEFVQRHHSDPVLADLRGRYEDFAQSTLRQRSARPQATVVLPVF